MSSYLSLAEHYDSLTGDVPYDELQSIYLSLLSPKEGEGILDLCCGTGTLTCALAGLGFDMTGVDLSPEMLEKAGEKARSLPEGQRPLFIMQDASELELYGTVNHALCSLDGINYIPPEDLPSVFSRLSLFIEKGGRLAFDMHMPSHLRALDGGTFVDEKEDLLCLWRGEFDYSENALFYGMDIFTLNEGVWLRRQEEHTEYAHTPGQIKKLLRENGFDNIKLHRRLLKGQPSRLFISARSLGKNQRSS
ncbi:MAG: class I SAM-dependent methyltransferase [Oscillospiraceae bacterium]|nr:class I SAM-dependent methyltransferase [Oscillospiraceae bacterium]